MNKNEKENIVKGIIFVLLIIILRMKILIFLILIGIYKNINKKNIRNFLDYVMEKIILLLHLFSEEIKNDDKLFNNISEKSIEVGKQLKLEVFNQIRKIKLEFNKYIINVFNNYIEEIIKDFKINNKTITEEDIIKVVNESVAITYENLFKEINDKVEKNNKELSNNINYMINNYMNKNNKENYEIINKEINKQIDENINLYNNQIEDFVKIQINSLKKDIDNSISTQLEISKDEFENINIDIIDLENKLKVYTNNVMTKYVEKNKEQLNISLEKFSKNFKELNEQVNEEKINEEINKSLEEFKEKYFDSLQKNVDEILDTVKELQELNITNFEIVKNKDIRIKFEEAFKVAEKEIDIISPWINNYVLYKSGVYGFIEKSLEKRVNIKILYGIGEFESNSKEYSNSRGQNSEEIVRKLKLDLKKYGQAFKIKKGNTHSKILICDDKFAIIGSFNFLSFDGEYKKDTRDEIAAITTDKKSIEMLRSQEFNF